uniref:Nudix hydrolase domain-containing protein n=1 Tax=Meloidogyne floridensis TaxID=298350 RepID=A0A915NGM8_9BILA
MFTAKNAELYVKYNPTKVFGLNLARSYLPSSHWIKPDLEDVNLYKDLWHSDNKLDLLPDHEKGNDKQRVINRCSFYGKYPVHNGYPLNPVARTGFKGRGSFGQWGPTNGAGAILYVTDEKDFNKFEFLGVENGKYEKRSYIVTPGGFVDMGEEFEYSAKRELIEEAFGLKKKRNKEEFEKMEEILGKGELVKFGGAELSQLSTDNAWTESITFAFGVDSTIKEELKLKKGSDAQQVMWIQIKPMHENVKTQLEKLFSLEERIDYILQNFK